MKALLLAGGLTLLVSVAFAASSLPKDAPVIEGTSLTEKELRQAIVDKTVYLNVSGFERTNFSRLVLLVPLSAVPPEEGLWKPASRRRPIRVWRDERAGDAVS